MGNLRMVESAEEELNGYKEKMEYWTNNSHILDAPSHLVELIKPFTKDNPKDLQSISADFYTGKKQIEDLSSILNMPHSTCDKYSGSEYLEILESLIPEINEYLSRVDTKLKSHLENESINVENFNSFKAVVEIFKLVIDFFKGYKRELEEEIPLIGKKGLEGVKEHLDLYIQSDLTTINSIKEMVATQYNIIFNADSKV